MVLSQPWKFENEYPVSVEKKTGRKYTKIWTGFPLVFLIISWLRNV